MEQPLGEGHRVGACPETGVVVELDEFVSTPAHRSVGVVHSTPRVLDRLQGALAKDVYLLGVARLEKVAD